MNISSFDLNRAKALHFLLEEAHVGRAAARLGITPAAASNALRRLRDELGDPLLAKKGRGLIRTRLGEELRSPARDVVAAAEALLRAATPFDPSRFCGRLSIAMSDHVAAILLPALDRLVATLAPQATLAIASVPAADNGWLESSGGVLIAPAGAQALHDRLAAEPFYDDRYVCVMRAGHRLARSAFDAAAYAAQGHILVVPRGLTLFGDVDEHLATLGLSRRVARVVPSFELALKVVRGSDLITAMPERYARAIDCCDLAIRELPLNLRPLAMRMFVHPVHQGDGRTSFIKQMLHQALRDASSPGRSVSRSEGASG